MPSRADGFKRVISDGALQTVKFGIADTIGVTLLVFRALTDITRIGWPLGRDRRPVIIGTGHSKRLMPFDQWDSIPRPGL